MVVGRGKVNCCWYPETREKERRLSGICILYTYMLIVHFSRFSAKAHLPTSQSFPNQTTYSVYVCAQMLDKGLANSLL